MTQFSTHLYFENSVEEFHLHETFSTTMKLLTLLQSLKKQIRVKSYK